MTQPGALLPGLTAVAHAIVVISVVGALGLFLGQLRWRGVGLGIAGVLFAGLGFGHAGVTVPEEVLEFLRESGLILFVYTIGIQVGPGFFSSLRRQGLRLNSLAAAVVLLGAALAVLFAKAGGIPAAAAVGAYSGAVTNTPSLAAAQQALKDLAAPAGAAGLTGIGYAVCYPFGVLGTILVLVLARAVFRVDAAQEARAVSPEEDAPEVAAVNIKVENRNIDGLPISKLPALESLGVRFSRLLHDGRVSLPRSDTLVRLGDVLRAVGPRQKLDELVLVLGRVSDLDLKSLPSRIMASRIIVTQGSALGKSLRELELADRYGVVVTRAARAEIEFVPGSDFTVHFGDTLLAVGEEEDVARFAAMVGNSPKALNHPQLIPVFIGIALGVLLGSLPLRVPGMAVPVKLGLAGGPLVAALLLSRVGQLGPLSWYMPISANFMLREMGIILFLACVGLAAGDRFVETLVRGAGLRWLACGAVITFVPLAAVGLFARWRFKLNYHVLCGTLAGSMTDPPALAYANAVAPCSATAVSYATVYPMTMLLRVVMAQVLVTVLF
ncbi:MAG: putative transporter [Elusimicrobia bacterium]|nr:putative transporter [Elusimicrobiota bacterium]